MANLVTLSNSVVGDLERTQVLIHRNLLLLLTFLTAIQQLLNSRIVIHDTIFSSCHKHHN